MEASLREFDSLSLDGRVLSRVRIETLVPVVEGDREQEAVVTPGLDGLRVDMEQVHDLVECQQAGIAQALVASLEGVVTSDSADDAHVECSALAGGEAAVVEDGGDLSLCMRVEESVDLVNDLLWGLSFLPGCLRLRQRPRLGCAALEPHVNRERIAFDEGNVLDKQSRHALSLALRRLGVAPYRGEVRG